MTDWLDELERLQRCARHGDQNDRDSYTNTLKCDAPRLLAIARAAREYRRTYLEGTRVRAEVDITWADRMADATLALDAALRGEP